MSLSGHCFAAALIFGRRRTQAKRSTSPFNNIRKVLARTKIGLVFSYILKERKSLWNRSGILFTSEMKWRNPKNFASIGATIVLGKKLGQLKIFRLMRLFYYHTRNFCRICFCWFWWQFLHSRKYPISIKDKPGNPLCEFRMYLGHNGYSPPQFLFPMFL